MSERPVFYVDLPVWDKIGQTDGSWKNVGEFKTKAEAVAFIREKIGDCDDEGRMPIIQEDIADEEDEAPAEHSADEGRAAAADSGSVPPSS